MAVQPVHLTREQLIIQALGERVPIVTAGNFTLYRRTRSASQVFVHDRRNGPESLPVAIITDQFGVWHVTHQDDRIEGREPVDVFEKWVALQR